MKKSGVIIGVLLFFVLNLVTAQPPFQVGTETNGFLIKIPQQEFLQVNESYNFNFHVINASDGQPINNATTNCYFHLDNRFGTELVKAQVPHISSNVVNEWEILIEGGNFSYVGTYTYNIQCSSATLGLGGYESVHLKTTRTGAELPLAESIIYIILTLGVFLIFALSFYIMLTIPYSNEVNEKGAVIKITKAKYFKLLLIGVTYALFVWLLNVLIGVSDNFVTLSLYYGFVSFLFTIFLNLTIPVFAIIFVIGLFEIIRDANLLKEIKRLGSALR